MPLETVEGSTNLYLTQSDQSLERRRRWCRPSNKRFSNMTKSVTDGSGTTHFHDVFNGTSVIGKAMVFVPAAVYMVESAPMVVYYHGHNSQGSIEDYIKAMKQRDFRPLLAAKSVVLVQPWGGTRSKFGAMATADALPTLIDSPEFTASA